jgi:ABC-2 type transport system ATP-binding protein
VSAIEIRGLTKAFGPTQAVVDLSLSVNRGEIYGFLGRNGAGKTTTIRMLLGMIRPDQGTISLLGRSVQPNQGPWSKVGALVETAVAWPDLTVRGNLRTLADLHGLSAPAIDGVMDLLSLTLLADRPARNLSLGNLQRLGLAMALLPDPEVLILDEPVNGLDPAGVVEIREVLVGLARDKGTTVFVSSHLLDEVARTCTRIGILHEGRLVKEVATADLDKLVSRRLVVETPDPEAARRALEAAGIPHARMAVEAEDLEDYFLRLTGGRS